MLSLFSPAGQKRLEKVVNAKMLCVFDFDGTLSPIVAQPEQARLPLTIKKRLIELAGLVPVAIITGRSLDDIRPRLGFEPHYIVGNHGLEGVPGWEARRDAYELLCKEWETALRHALHDKNNFDPGIKVENKRYSLSVHYRLARDQDDAEKKLKMFFDKFVPSARVIAGKCVFSLVPPEAMDKGRALEQLMLLSQSASAIYVGDDVTDEDVFELARDDLMSIRVGFAKDSAAQYFLAHAGEMAQLLDDLIRRLRRICRKGGNGSQARIFA
ncbi:MAG: trehalose-phosphatase [Oxalobacter sp.]|nr:MAG: trehalose-phosphatase [Oxalobacter sp.]